MPDIIVRPARREDFPAWQPLWQGYNAFYGRAGDTALPEEITALTWQRFFDPLEPLAALVAERGGSLVGIAHYFVHRSTIEAVGRCYLADLFTDPAHRGRGIARRLIEAVYADARESGVGSVWWQTHETNATARKLYDRLADRSGFVVYRRTLDQIPKSEADA